MMVSVEGNNKGWTPEEEVTAHFAELFASHEASPTLPPDCTAKHEPIECHGFGKWLDVPALMARVKGKSAD